MPKEFIEETKNYVSLQELRKLYIKYFLKNIKISVKNDQVKAETIK